MIEIGVVDPIHSTVRKSDVATVKPCLSYDSVYWKQGPFGRKREHYRKHVFMGKSGTHWTFLTGLVPRVRHHLRASGEQVSILNKENAWPKIIASTPDLPGIKYHDFQRDLIDKALKEVRGLVVAPTGSGKTIIQLGIIKALENYNVLLLAHTVGIVEQTYQELSKFGFKNIQIITGEHGRSPLMGSVVVSTMQSFVMYNAMEVAAYFHAVIVDEAHHVTSETGTYGEILQTLLAPVRLGFTATPPTDPKAQFAAEGLLGPLIGRLTIQEAADLDILAKPKIKLVRSRFQQHISNLKRYEEVYQIGVVENRSRNRQILDLVYSYVSVNKTVLIIVNRIEHGTILQELALRRFNLEVPFVQGSTLGVDRQDIKSKLNTKHHKCVIATTVWREGINIPSLNVVVNAAGGKSEIMTLQAIGRGLRKTDEKDEVLIVDFFDPSHHFLISHFGERVTLYIDNEWL